MLTFLFIFRGGFAVYRIAQYCPELVTHRISICTPFNPPQKDFLPLEDLVKNRIPYFAYQLQFVSGELEKVIKSKDEIRQFLLSLYGGRTPEGKPGFDVFKGAILDRLPGLRRSWVISEDVRLPILIRTLDSMINCCAGTRILRQRILPLWYPRST